MSLSIIQSYANIGIDAPAVKVEVHLSNGLPKLSIVGLPEAAVKESKDRVRSAIINSRFKFPSTYRITVNLSPADLPKSGGRFDLPIALGILVASGQVERETIDQYAFIGELALSGELLPVNALLPVAIACSKSGEKLIVPKRGCQSVQQSNYEGIFTASTLLEVCNHLNQSITLPHYQPVDLDEQIVLPDLADVKGQPQARRALEIAASGRHNLLMIGPPGTGKSMLANRLPSIFPPLTQQEAIEVASIYSVADIEKTNFNQPPARSPHHTSSAVAIVGGGSKPVPGEISLAHKGLLFLDELPEYNRSVLESLREPLETGHIVISRSTMKVKYDSDFMLVTACNPCPCGFSGDKFKPCRCNDTQISRYRNKISGPLLDRIDLHIQVTRPDNPDFFSDKIEESSAEVRERVIQARNRQISRQGCPNANLQGKALEQHIKLDKTQKDFLYNAMQKLNLSPRSIHRIMRVSRTIADMENVEDIQQQHLVETLSFRQLW